MGVENEQELRALDAWLALHVFGCTTSETSMDMICVCGLGVEGVNQDWPAVHWKDGSGEGYPPLFSSTGDGMLLVMAALRARGLGWVLGDCYSDVVTATVLDEEAGTRADEQAATAPLAVALAAKAALERAAS